MTSTYTNFARVALLGCVLAVAGGCKSGRDEVMGAPEQIYSRGETLLRSGDYNGAIRYYEALEARYPFSEQARQARLDIIYAYYRSRQSESAIDAADQFIRENPTHPRIDYAWYMKGLVHFERMPNVLERWFRADLTRRPPADARRSFQAFQTLVERFPQSEYAHDSRQRMVFLRNRLADYEVHVADYYLRRRAYVAALNRAKFCIENYDGAPATREALDVMVAAYEGLGLEELAEKARIVYATNFPRDRIQRDTKPWYQFW